MSKQSQGTIPIRPDATAAAKENLPSRRRRDALKQGAYDPCVPPATCPGCFSRVWQSRPGDCSPRLKRGAILHDHQEGGFGFGGQTGSVVIATSTRQRKRPEFSRKL